MQNLLYICINNYKCSTRVEGGGVLFPCSFLLVSKRNFENSKIIIKTWPFAKAHKGPSWNSMCKK